MSIALRLSAVLVSGCVLVACGPPPAAQNDGTVQGAQGGPTPESSVEVAPVAEVPTAEPSSAPAPPPAAIPFRAMVAAGNVEECIAKLRDTVPPGDPPKRDGEPEYRDGLSAEKGNDLNRARKSYFKLVQNYPQSDFIPAAYFAFGELFGAEAKQDPSKIALAEQSYNEVMKYPPPGNSLFAVTQYRMGQLLSSKDSVKALASFMKAGKADHEATKLGCAVEVAAAAVTASVPVFASVGDPSKAWSFYLSVTGDGARTAQVTLLLAERYAASSKGDDAATVLVSSVESGARVQPDAAAKALYCKRATAASAAARTSATRATAALDRAIGAACP